MAKLISTNPARNFKKIGEVTISSTKEIKTKVQEAKYAQEDWQNIGIEKRILYLKKVYDAFYKRQQELSEIACSEMGFPIEQQKMFDLGDGFTYFKWYLENTQRILKPEITFENKNEKHTVFFEPTGVAAVIQPWNFPFCQWSWSVVPNLIAGNTVIFKHSEEVPLTGRLIEEIINSCNLPKGVFSEIYGNGEVGKTLINQDIDLITFTGSEKTGKYIYKTAAEKFIKVVLELGGSAPGIVFEDANIDKAVEHIYAVRFTNCGQACDGLKRLIVHKKILKDVVTKLKDIVTSKVIGDPLDAKTDFGPLVSKKQQELISSQVKDAQLKGAKIVIGGKKPKDLQGAFYQPTIITNISKNMRVWKEEVFGPVLPIISFTQDEEAIQLANDTTYGLGSYVYTKDLKRAQHIAEKIKAGMVSINGTNYVYPFNPFGGYKNSGIGREHGRFGLEELSQIKIVSSEK
jgi:succinate-semialdehyde dehydrogenase/glutarate-semialdehyde dehydrogenase